MDYTMMHGSINIKFFYFLRNVLYLTDVVVVVVVSLL
jgi:hypothetical protein